MGKRALLTIDDGPSTLTGGMVLFLRESQIPAVMFCQGNHLELRSDAAVRALEAGMVLGNHGFSHTGFSNLTPTQAEEEILKTEALLDAVYHRAGVTRDLRLFRFPYGDKGGPKKAEMAAILARSGFDRLDTSDITYPWFADHGLDRDLDVFWTFDFLDYRLVPAEHPLPWDQLLGRLVDPAPAQGGSLVTGESAEIVLMHDHPHTEAFHPGYYQQLIRRTLELGVEFVAPKRSVPSPV